MRRPVCSAYRIERSIANRLKLHEYPCACTACRGAVIRKVSTIASHHTKNGRDPYLQFPVLVSLFKTETVRNEQRSFSFG